jgi:hypothetical protein
LFNRLAMVVEGPEKTERLLDGQLVGELSLLELDAETLPQLLLVGLPSAAEYLDLSTIGRKQAFQNLDRRGLAGAVRSEQSIAFASAHAERQPVDCHDIAVAFLQILASHCKFHVAHSPRKL